MSTQTAPYRAQYTGCESIDLSPGETVTVLYVYGNGIAKICYTGEEQDDIEGEGIWEVSIDNLGPVPSEVE